MNGGCPGGVPVSSSLSACLHGRCDRSIRNLRQAGAPDAGDFSVPPVASISRRKDHTGHQPSKVQFRNALLAPPVFLTIFQGSWFPLHLRRHLHLLTATSTSMYMIVPYLLSRNGKYLTLGLLSYTEYPHFIFRSLR